MIDFNALGERTEITIDDVNWLLDKFYPKIILIISILQMDIFAYP